MPHDACESPTRACARSTKSDKLYRIDKAFMVLIVAESKASVHVFCVPHRSGGLSLTDGRLVFRSRTMIVPVSLVMPTTSWPVVVECARLKGFNVPRVFVDGTISSGGKYPWDIKCSNPLGPINYLEYGKGHNASIGFSIVSLQSGQWKFRLTVSSNMVTRGLIRNNEIRRRR